MDCHTWGDLILKDISIIGDGCAAMSFASKMGSLPHHSLTIQIPKNAPEKKDHCWGFWSHPVVEEAVELSKYSWEKWSIITEKETIVLESVEKPYHVLKRKDWIDYCQSIAQKHEVSFVPQDSIEKNPKHLFDTRPPSVPKNAMLQHFLGQTIRVEKGCFDPTTVTLMDFRVDQSNGMHFIYLIPFSDTEALVESTLFSTEKLSESFYREAIEAYVREVYDVSKFEIIEEESGVIPMGELSRHDPSIPGLGGNGGAIRPGSGYAFIFIQKQILEAIQRVEQNKPLRFKSPHKKIDLWMDGILLLILRHWPSHAPIIFSRMGKRLNGDQFARFLSGDVDWKLRLKVIFSMPKLIFARGFVKWAIKI
ncbi:MAG: lycopene cyclase family protein [Candidatus Poseidoniaceae archaeon]